MMMGICLLQVEEKHGERAGLLQNTLSHCVKARVL